jgi:hypothetical protein
MGFFYLYYALGLPTFLFIVIALYLLFTGTRHRSLCQKKPLTVAQAREKRSMLAGSSKSQVRTCGRRRALVSA